MFAEDPKAIIIYTGHDEMIGGDAHYTFDLVNKLIDNGYRVKLFTDRNKLFAERAEAWLKVQIPIHYLDTSPKLFESHFFERLYDHLEDSSKKLKLNLIERIIHRLLGFDIASRKLHWYLKLAARILTMTYLRGHLVNFRLFSELMKHPENRGAVFHFNNGGFPAKDAGIWAMWAARRAGVKRIVMTVHNIAAQRRLPIDLVYDAIARNCCDLIITASDAVKCGLLNNRAIPSPLCRTIRCGLEDAEPLNSRDCLRKLEELAIPSTRPVLLIAGNYEEERKGHTQLLQALAIVKVQFPEILLLIVGSGGKERKRELDNYVKELAINGNVKFLGYRTDISELNCISDVSLTPSTGVESIPYTIIEAARMATPVITTTMGGCSEAVIDGQTGFVVEPGNIKMLADRITILLSDPALRRRMGKEGRALFLERFMLETVTQEHFNVYSGT